MNTLNTMLLAMTLGLTAITASAHEGNSPETRVVSFTALDTTSAGGAEELYLRIRAAAREVCASADGAMLSEKHQYRSCVDTSIATAIKQVNQPLLTKTYAARTRGGTIRVASR